jgi:hypothetical protein
VVEALSSRYLGPDYSAPSSKAGVNVADVDALAAASFPLCMQHLLHKVREDHHLKHGGRQQLGLFLKVSHRGSWGGNPCMRRAEAGSQKRPTGLPSKWWFRCWKSLLFRDAAFS